MADRITATVEALDALARLTVKHGALMLYQSGGCCDGSSPLCLQAGELLTGPGDDRAWLQSGDIVAASPHVHECILGVISDM